MSDRARAEDACRAGGLVKAASNRIPGAGGRLFCLGDSVHSGVSRHGCTHTETHRGFNDGEASVPLGIARLHSGRAPMFQCLLLLSERGSIETAPSLDVTGTDRRKNPSVLRTRHCLSSKHEENDASLLARSAWSACDHDDMGWDIRQDGRLRPIEMGWGVSK